MAEKMNCPVCNSYTSSIAAAVEEGHPCPVCGAPAAVIIEISLLRKQHGESKLADRTEELLIQNGKLRIEKDRLKKIIDAIKWELKQGSEA